MSTLIHNFIVCLTTAVKLYREKFQATQGDELALLFQLKIILSKVLNRWMHWGGGGR